MLINKITHEGIAAVRSRLRESEAEIAAIKDPKVARQAREVYGNLNDMLAAMVPDDDSLTDAGEG